MLQVEQDVQRIELNDSNDCDSRKFLRIYSRTQFNIFDVLDNLGLHYSNSANNPENKEIKKYRNSGLWYRGSRQSKHEPLRVDVRVGCECEHDCCGHLCDLSFEIIMVEAYFFVIERQSYNY